jgi:SPP1 gp7 family putative phage head morphogenesis protein
MIDIHSIARVSRQKHRKQERALRPVRPSRKSEAQYRGKLLSLVAVLKKQALDELGPVLKQLEPSYAKDAADWGEKLKSVFLRLQSMTAGVSAWAVKQANAIATAVLGDVDTRLTGSIKQSLKVDITGMLGKEGAIRDAMSMAVKANVELITSIPEQYLDKIEQAVMEAMSEGLRHEDIIKEIERIGGVTESRAELIARDQIGKLNSDFNRVRQTDLGIEEYTWSTSGDERVRDEHADLDGQTFRWDDPPPDGHPGEAIQCRCLATPIFKLETNETDSSQ